MDSVIIFLLVVLIIFAGVAFLIITEMLKRIEKDLRVVKKIEANKVRKETETVLEHKMPKPTFFEPVTVDDLK